MVYLFIGMVYLFIGQDSYSKDVRLKRLKEEYLLNKTKEFNLDTLYSKELTLKGLQEILLYLPLNSDRRIVVIKNAQDLKQDIKEFILKYIKKPHPKIILVLDINRQDPQDEFIKYIIRDAKVFRFREPPALNTFTLSRQIELKRPDYALRLLHQLLENGEKPERLLGGLRHSWERSASGTLQIRKGLRLLLNCDMDIKTGRLKPEVALERLIINLCCFKKS